MKLTGTTLALWILIALYACGRALQTLDLSYVPFLAVVALNVFPPIAFALIHGSMLYRFRDVLCFCMLCLVVGNVVENLGVLTGFPFGRYYFTDAMGPKLFHVPIMLGLAYLGMGYLSWTLGCLIIGDKESPMRGSRVVALPVAGSFIMVAWDLAMDPVWSTYRHVWIWQHGGPYFGVPFTNFFGWWLTIYLIYQLFALYLRSRTIAPRQLVLRGWRLPVIFYGLCAAGNVSLLWAHNSQRLSVIADATGTLWRVNDIVGNCALVSIFTMGAFAAFAWFRLAGKNDQVH
ncbi:MAG TPA: carotenoid biosynthesis protein [Alphaproteobacteria bacterium]|nr:carotenoid biosynthesis protein [Alphaproteobacteria bacterium]